VWERLRSLADFAPRRFGALKRHRGNAAVIINTPPGVCAGR
jgi:hypothetical protein